MTPERKRNLLKLPIVLFIRIPILLPFFVLSRIGEHAERIGGWIGRYIPALEREK